MDEVKILSMHWYYEHRVYYQHSFVVLKTELSEGEKEIFPDVDYKYYVTEKNDLGVIWSVHYDWHNATNMKTEHDGIHVVISKSKVS